MIFIIILNKVPLNQYVIREIVKLRICSFLCDNDTVKLELKIRFKVFSHLIGIYSSTLFS